MSDKKIKVFLGGFINYTNAQNLNCRALAEHLDKNKFEIYTLTLSAGTLPRLESEKRVNTFNCFKPARISIYLGFLWGIFNCDIAYLPKGEVWKWNRFLLTLFRKKSFSTIEGILDKDNLESAVAVLGSYDNVLASRNFFTKSFAITQFLGNYNDRHHNIKVESKPLYLGCDTILFKNEAYKSGGLSKVVYVGRLKKRKGVYDFLMIAQHFPELQFYIFGDGEEKLPVESFILENKLENITLMGVCDHATLAIFLKEVNLHILPSRSEGFPKVTLETAAAGVPSIVYDDYGAQEWITNGENGWVVKTVDDIIAIIKDLESNPKKLKSVSHEAIKLAESFDWKVRVKDWEEEIKELKSCKYEFSNKFKI